MWWNLLSGLIGVLLTLAYTHVIRLMQERRAFRRMKTGLRVECANIQASMKSVRKVYESSTGMVEWRVDVSLFLSVKEKLISRYDDDILLAILNGVHSLSVALNRTLDIYRDECFKSIGLTKSTLPTQILEIRKVILTSIDQLDVALGDLGKRLSLSDDCSRTFWWVRPNTKI